MSFVVYIKTDDVYKYRSSDIDFKDFTNLYKKCTEKTYSFSVIDATFT